MKQTYEFWERYYREQKRYEFEEYSKFAAEKAESKRMKREKRVHEATGLRQEYERIQARLAEEQARYRALSAEIADAKTALRDAARKQWLAALNEEVHKWEKTPEETKNRRLLPEPNVIYYDGCN